jgi:subtilisin family serine protease
MNSTRVLLAATAAAAAISIGTPAAAKPGDKIDGSYICVFKSDTVARGNVRSEANKAASQGGGNVKHVYENSIRGFSTNMSAVAASKIAAHNPKVAYCEQDQEMGFEQDSDALTFRQLGKPAPTQPGEQVPWGVTRVKGGAGSTAKGRAWIIDTGIDLDHPDLNVNTALSRNFVSRETSPDDLNGHGSHVAGTIGAVDNQIGVIGVAPGAEVVAVRVLNRRGSGSNSDVIAGVDYVASQVRAGVAKAGDVANMSLGGSVSSALDTAVKNAAATGIRFTLAAGNESDDANNHSPARAEGSNIYTVSSFAKGDVWSSFSNYGNPPIDKAEPGSSILSTYKDGGYATASGTSMAAPHLAGLLLIGTPANDGVVSGDPDGKPDPIGAKN